MASTGPAWLIKGVAVIGRHKLRLLFEDGTVGDVSFEEDAWDGVFAPLRDPARFANVTVLGGPSSGPKTSSTGRRSLCTKPPGPTRSPRSSEVDSQGCAYLKGALGWW